MRFADWFHKRHSGQQRDASDDAGYDDVRDRVREVALEFKDRGAFSERARQAAQELGPQSIPALLSLMHRQGLEPPELKEDLQGLGAWLSLWQAALFEILYHLREAALPALRGVAYGEYDWTQCTAIGILCRLAIEGLERERIAAEIVADIPNWRYEAVLSTVDDLAQLAPYAPPVAGKLQEMAKEWAEDDPIEAMEIIGPLVRHAPETAAVFEPTLRHILREVGRDSRSPLADGQVVQIDSRDGEAAFVALSGPTYPSLPDFHAVRAAMLLNDLFPGDPEATKSLQQWAEDHPDEAARQEIAEYLSEKRGSA